MVSQKHFINESKINGIENKNSNVTVIMDSKDLMCKKNSSPKFMFRFNN